MKSELKLPDISKCEVAVLGLGYVGLPLAVGISRCKICNLTNNILNRKVIGFDISIDRVNELSRGFDRTKELSDTNLNESGIFFTNNYDDLTKSDVFLVTVPTPIDEMKVPDLEPLKSATKIIAETIKKVTKSIKPLIIYESTVYPGATEEICIPIIEKISGLKLNEHFCCGFSPERINPGDKEHTLDKIIKVTSGSNKESLEWIDNFYGSFISAGTHKAASIKVAEAAKIIENTQRDLNIALVNELAILFKKMQIDTLDVLKAAETKWNFLPFKPGLVGGHCIGVDPYYLTYKAKKINYSPQIVLAGRAINDHMGKWVVDQLILCMAKRGLIIANSKVLILGLSFKENCTDIRNTKVEDIFEFLNEYNVDPYIYDPCVDINHANKKFPQKVFSEIPSEHKFTAAIIAVAHNQFKSFTYKQWNSLTKEEGIIFDLKGIVPRELADIRM